MPSLLASCCISCAEVSIYECEEITVPGLLISTAYYWKITDQFGNLYTGSGTTDTNGNLIIAADDLQYGMLSYGAGTLTITVKLNESDAENAIITVADVEYECLMVTIVAPATVADCEEAGDYAIEIITDDAQVMETSFSSSAADLFFKKKAGDRNYRNMLAEPFFSKLNALSFPNKMYPGGGVIGNYTNPPIGGNNQDGYGMEAADFVGTSDNITTYNDHVGDPGYPLWGHSFESDFKDLKSGLGCRGDVCFNIRHGNTDEFTWYVTGLDPEYVMLGAELQGSWNAAAYKTAADLIIAYSNSSHPDVKIILNAGLVYKTNATTVDWNNIIKTIAGAHSAGYYIQVRDQVPGLSANQENNIILLQNYFDSILPANLVTFKGIFDELGPTLKMAIVQINLEDNRSEQIPHYIDNTVVGNWALGKVYEWILLNTADVSYAAWMSDKNLINNNDVTNNNYAQLVHLSPLWAMQNVGSVTFTGLEGVSGVIAWSGTQYYLMVNNSSAVQYNIPVSELSIDGIAFAGTVTRSTRYGATLYSDVQGETATGEAEIKILPFSNSLIGFNVI